MLLHEHPGFQSDIVLILETIGASLIIGRLAYNTRNGVTNDNCNSVFHVCLGVTMKQRKLRW